MSKKEKEELKTDTPSTQEQGTQNVDAPVQEQNQESAAGEETNEETPEDKIAKLETELEKQKNDYLFLMAEFDNYRKRTLREKADLIKYGGEKAMLELLPVIDDLERALEAIGQTADVDALKEGVNLIYNKFMAYLDKQQVKPMESTGAAFDSDIHEAVTIFPAPDESQKGKVIDTVLKGYMINDKVLRHAKVVVGK